MFANRNRIPKSQLPDKAPYTIHNPHSRPLSERTWPQDHLQIISIDPSIKNLGFRIEKRYYDGKIETLVLSRTTFGVNSVVTETTANGSQQTVNTLFREISQFLNQFRELFPSTHIMIMERQLPQNYKAVRVSQHVLTEMMSRLTDLPLLPVIVEVDSKLKSRQLGCPKGLNERQTKLWLIEKALDLCSKRADDFSFGLISRSRKKDDMADVICQVEAWCSLVGFPVTAPVIKLSVRPAVTSAPAHPPAPPKPKLVIASSSVGPSAPTVGRPPQPSGPVEPLPDKRPITKPKLVIAPS